MIFYDNFAQLKRRCNLHLIILDESKDKYLNKREGVPYVKFLPIYIF